MATKSSNEFQKALYAKLTGDATLMALITGVHDFAPGGTVFPYVTIGDDRDGEWDTKDQTGSDMTAKIHTWTQSEGRKEVKDIQSQIYSLLHRQTLTLSGFTVILMQEDFQEIMLDEDGKSHHGIQQFQVLIREG